MNKQGKITVVGSNMIDLTSYLNRTPKKGETVFGKAFHQGFGGKGSNQAVMASLLGADVSMITAIGDDTYGKQWLEHYQSENIRTDSVKVIKGKSSGIASIWVEADGDNRIVITPGANNELTANFVADSFKHLPQADVVLSQLENPQKAILAGFKQAKKSGAITILNPAPADVLEQGMLDYTDWLVPNETELKYLAKHMYQMESEDPFELIQSFAEKTETNLVVTLGAQGALIFMPDKHGAPLIVPTITAKPKDTTGAGDAFCGTFAYGLSTGMDHEQAVKMANVVASNSVLKNGTQTSYARGKELQDLIKTLI